MAIFSPTAWMMKGGGGSSAEAVPSGDSDPFKTRTSVDFSISGFTFYRSSWQVSFTIDKSSFSNRYGKLWIEVNRNAEGKKVSWNYYDLGAKVDFQKIGVRQTVSFSKQISKNSEAKKAISYTSNSNIYFLFLSDNEICKNQIHPTVEGDPTPIPKN